MLLGMLLVWTNVGKHLKASMHLEPCIQGAAAMSQTKLENHLSPLINKYWITSKILTQPDILVVDLQIQKELIEQRNDASS